MLAARCEHGSKPCLAARHVLVGLGCMLQRKNFGHSSHTGEHAATAVPTASTIPAISCPGDLH